MSLLSSMSMPSRGRPEEIHSHSFFVMAGIEGAWMSWKALAARGDEGRETCPALNSHFSMWHVLGAVSVSSTDCCWYLRLIWCITASHLMCSSCK